MVLGADCFGKVFNMIRENCKKEYTLLVTDYIQLYGSKYNFYYKKISMGYGFGYRFIAEMVAEGTPIKVSTDISSETIEFAPISIEAGIENVRLELKKKLIAILSEKYRIPKRCFFPEPSKSGTGYI